MVEAQVLPLRRIDHVRFFVGNARQSAYFYRNAFGFDVVAYAGLAPITRQSADTIHHGPLPAGAVLALGVSARGCSADPAPSPPDGRYMRFSGNGGYGCGPGGDGQAVNPPPSAVVDPAGNRVRYQYDLAGNCTWSDGGHACRLSRASRLV